MAGVVDLFLIYNFVRRLTLPFNQWKAFKTGVIDDEGNILIAKAFRTEEQNRSFKMFDVLIRNIKSILAKIPGGNTKLVTFASALFLIKEGHNYHDKEIMEDEFLLLMKEYWDQVTPEMLAEDAAANATVGGHIAGINSNDSFAGTKVFQVDHETQWKSRFGKPKWARYKNYVGEDEVGDEIRQYAKKHPKSNIILQNSKTGAMMYFRRQ